MDSETHLEDSHAELAIEDVNELACTPKFKPDPTALEPPVVGELLVAQLEIAGRSMSQNP